jgi:hypothetical protein
VEDGNIRHKAWCLAIAKPEEGERVVLKECNDKDAILVSEECKYTGVRYMGVEGGGARGLRGSTSPGLEFYHLSGTFYTWVKLPSPKNFFFLLGRNGAIMIIH